MIPPLLTLSPLGRGWPGGPVRGLRSCRTFRNAQPPHPNPLPGGERGLPSPLLTLAHAPPATSFQGAVP
ncbi:hypothetical protein DS843_22245 [Roseomonas genomospecies 6]|uniref:Uncharacterized protein n=1 Tax=Roseomonas genomospecies 6 TaxID=214106 RepID=A0A9W7KQR9_9PROT|nr:hypothetical protein DS843_22245 [Roseomonas genomospecies 6]